MAWYTYILRCADESLYTGITTDLARRFAMHKSGRGAKYTASHPPAAFECAFESAGRPEASRLEAALKKLTRAEKLSLIAGDDSLLPQSITCTRINISPEGRIL